MTDEQIERLMKRFETRCAQLLAVENRLNGYSAAFWRAVERVKSLEREKSRGTWLTPRQAVWRGYFGSRKTAANLRHQGRGPVYHKTNNGRVLYLLADLDDWVRSSRIETRQVELPKEVQENRELFHALRTLGIHRGSAAKAVGISTSTARRWDKKATPRV